MRLKCLNNNNSRQKVREGKQRRTKLYVERKGDQERKLRLP